MGLNPSHLIVPRRRGPLRLQTRGRWWSAS
jgi:hypothetical protein